MGERAMENRKKWAMEIKWLFGRLWQQDTPTTFYGLAEVWGCSHKTAQSRIRALCEANILYGYRPEGWWLNHYVRGSEFDKVVYGE